MDATTGLLIDLFQAAPLDAASGPGVVAAALGVLGVAAGSVLLRRGLHRK